MDTGFQTPTFLIQNFKAELLNTFGSRYSSLVLFGSFARGEARPDSDIDLLLVLKDSVHGKDDLESVIPIVSKFLLDFGVIFSVTIKTEKEMLTQKEGLMRNIALEGVTQ